MGEGGKGKGDKREERARRGRDSRVKRRVEEGCREGVGEVRGG